MKLPILVFVSLLACSVAAAQTGPSRPRITGIESVRLYVTNIDKAREFYSKLYGVRLRGGMCPDTSGKCFTIGWLRGQTIPVTTCADPGGTAIGQHLRQILLFGREHCIAVDLCDRLIHVAQRIAQPTSPHAWPSADAARAWRASSLALRTSGRKRSDGGARSRRVG